MNFRSTRNLFTESSQLSFLPKSLNFTLKTDPCSNFSANSSIISQSHASLQEILFFFRYKSRKWVAYCWNLLIFELGIQKFWYLDESISSSSVCPNIFCKASSRTSGSWDSLTVFQLIELGSLINSFRSFLRGVTFDQTFEFNFSLAS